MYLFGVYPYYLELEYRDKFILHYQIYNSSNHVIRVPKEYRDLSLFDNIVILKGERILTYCKKSFLIFKIKGSSLKLEKEIPINSKEKIKILDINSSETRILFKGIEDTIFLYDLINKKICKVKSKFYNDEIFKKAQFLDDRYFYVNYCDQSYLWDSHNPQKSIYYSSTNQQEFYPVKYKDVIILSHDYVIRLFNLITREDTELLNSENFFGYNINEGKISGYLSETMIFREWSLETGEILKSEVVQVIPKKIEWKEYQYLFPEQTEEDKQKLSEEIRKYLSENLPLSKNMISILTKFF